MAIIAVMDGINKELMECSLVELHLRFLPSALEVTAIATATAGETAPRTMDVLILAAKESYGQPPTP